MRSLANPPGTVAAAAFAATLTVALTVSPAPLSAQYESLRARRIWKGETDNICCYTVPAPSPDGRYVPGVDWYSGDLAYLDLQEDVWIRVTAKGEWEESGAFSMNAIFSPDGSHLAHSWWTETGPRTGSWDLRVQDISGGNPRVLVRAGDGEVWPLDWSPDGALILAGAIPESPLAGVGGLQLLLVPVNGGEVTVLKEFSADVSRGASSARFSPDGQWIAYTEYAGEPPLADVRLLSLDGALDRGLVTGNGDDHLMDWLPDGSGILFHSERDLTQAIWRLRIEDGFPAGDPEMLKAELWDMVPMGFGSAGFYYLVPTEAPQVYTASVDFERGELVSAPAPVRDLSAGPSRLPAWSPDGRQLAFLSGNAPVGRPELVVQSLETGETRTVSLPFDTPTSLSWISDGRTIAVSGGYEGVWGLHRFDLQSGEVATLVTPEALDRQGAIGGPAGFDLSRDGRTIFYRRPSAEGGLELVAREPESGNETVVASYGERDARFEELPGGAGFAVVSGATERDEPLKISRIRADGTGSVGLWEGPNEFLNVPRMIGTEDGRHLLLAGFLRTGEFALFSVDLQTGERKEIYRSVDDDPAGAMRTISLHPDGSRIAFFRGVGEGEIWVMEGF